MHLKNFSIINREDKIEMSPCYDLLNTTIALEGAPEEIALTLKGKKKNLTRQILVDYFGGERCGINGKVITRAVEILVGAKQGWMEEIDNSFLSGVMKERYADLVGSRFSRLEL